MDRMLAVLISVLAFAPSQTTTLTCPELATGGPFQVFVDGDGNGSIDFIVRSVGEVAKVPDPAEFAECLDGPGVPAPDECRVFDFDGDRYVDLRDAARYQRILSYMVEPAAGERLVYVHSATSEGVAWFGGWGPRIGYAAVSGQQVRVPDSLIESLGACYAEEYVDEEWQGRWECE